VSALQTGGDTAPPQYRDDFTNLPNSLSSAPHLPVGVNSPLRVEFSDDAGGFATISKSQSLLFTGSGNRVTLWDLKTGYLLAKKEFPFDVCGLEYDHEGNDLWLLWNDDPRYGNLRLSRLDPTNWRISEDSAQLDLFRPGGAMGIVSPDADLVVVSKVYTFPKSGSSQDYTELSLFKSHLGESGKTLPKLATLNLKGIWSLGTFLNAKAFTLIGQNGSENLLLANDIVNNSSHESGPAVSENLRTFEEVAAKRDKEMVGLCAAAANVIKAGRQKIGGKQPTQIHLRAKDQDVCLWSVTTSTQTQNLITREQRSDEISLKDKSAPTAQQAQKHNAEKTAFDERKLTWADSILRLVTKRWLLSQQETINDVAPSVTSTEIDLNTLIVHRTTDPEVSSRINSQLLKVDDEGIVRTEDGSVVFKLRQYSGRAAVWRVPESHYYLVALDTLGVGGESTTLVECVDQSGAVLSSTACGDFLCICYFPQIAFAPDGGAFALFGSGQKNHAAPAQFFELDTRQRNPSVKWVSGGENELLSDTVSLDFYPHVLYLKPDSAFVTRFGSNQIVGRWGNDANPGYVSGDTAFAINVRNRLVAVVGADGDRVQLLHVGENGVLSGIGILKLDDASLALVTADYFYIQRGDPARGIHFVQGSRAFPFEQFDLRLNRPDIILERLGAPPEALAIAKQLRDKRLKRMGITEDMLKPDFHVPELEIVGDVPAATDAGEITLAIKASDSKHPLERLKVFVNNVPVNGRDGELLREEGKSGGGLLGQITGAFSEKSIGPQTLERTIPIKLAVGRNKIQVSVLNNAGAESLYANAEVNCTAKRPKPTLYAVAMGVSEYSNPDWNLKYAAKDARDVLTRLKAKAGGSYGEVKELLFTDKEVTKESISKIKDFLKGATIDDTVLMFVAGHGLLDSNYDYYFGTTDIDFNNPAEAGIAFEAFDDLLAELPSLKKSLLIDTCHAGELDEEEKTLLASAGGVSAALPTSNGVAVRSIGTRGMNVKAGEGARGASEWYDRLQGLFIDLRRGSGSTILSSSAGAEYALESSEQQNGLFTYAVLEALDGKREADTNKDGSVQMSELGEYVKKRVSELTNNKQTPNTRPLNLEGDFTLARTQ